MKYNCILFFYLNLFRLEGVSGLGKIIFFLSELSRHFGIYTRQCQTGSAPRLQVPHQGKTNGRKINSLFASQLWNLICQIIKFTLHVKFIMTTFRLKRSRSCSSLWKRRLWRSPFTPWSSWPSGASVLGMVLERHIVSSATAYTSKVFKTTIHFCSCTWCWRLVWWYM